MPVARLVGSTYTLGTNATIEDASNLFQNCDTQTPAIVTNNYSSTSWQNLVTVRGFNFSAIPANIILSTAFVRVREQGDGGLSNARVRSKGTAGKSISPTATGIKNYRISVFDLGYSSWSEVVADGDTFRVLFQGQNRKAGTYGKLYIYGLELEVTYELPPEKLYFKSAGSWVEASKAYKKTNGVWVEQTDLTTVFDSSTNYVKGN